MVLVGDSRFFAFQTAIDWSQSPQPSLGRVGAVFRRRIECDGGARRNPDDCVDDEFK
jgi:hypothetical protein